MTAVNVHSVRGSHATTTTLRSRLIPADATRAPSTTGQPRHEDHHRAAARERCAAMKLVIVRNGGTEWTLCPRYTGNTDLPLTPNGCVRPQLAPLVERALTARMRWRFQPPSTRHRSCRPRPIRPALHRGSACRRIPLRRLRRADRRTDPPVGTRLGHLARRMSPWRINRGGGRARRCLFSSRTCSTSARRSWSSRTGHFSRIRAARALGLAALNGRLFAGITASISVIEDNHAEPCVGRWNVDAALLDDGENRNPAHHGMSLPEPRTTDRLWRAARQISG